MAHTVGIFVFPDIEILDLGGPLEVFTTAARMARRLSLGPVGEFQVITFATSLEPILTRGGLKVIPDAVLSSSPPLDVLVVPGGIVDAELGKPEVISWIRERSREAKLTASVCNGAFLLAEAGLLNGLRATTHWEDADALAQRYPAVSVVPEKRWEDQGRMVTSAGISAGIDMSLHLVERLAGRALAERTARQMDYHWRD